MEDHLEIKHWSSWELHEYGMLDNMGTQHNLTAVC